MSDNSHLERDRAAAPKVVWKAGEELNTEAVEVALGEPARAVEHRSFGPGLLWMLGDADSQTQVEFYPACQLARVRLGNGTLSQETREYPVNSISVYDSLGATSLAIQSVGPDWATILCVSRSGEIDEFRRRTRAAGPSRNGFQLPVGPIVNHTEATDDPRATVTVNEAAELIGCHATTVDYLIRKERLPASKRGRQWFLDRRAVESYRPSRRGRRRSE
jgi:excisionase family DNA binding protein